MLFYSDPKQDKEPDKVDDPPEFPAEVKAMNAENPQRKGKHPGNRLGFTTIRFFDHLKGLFRNLLQVMPNMIRRRDALVADDRQGHPFTGNSEERSFPGYVFELVVAHMDRLQPGVVADVFKDPLRDKDPSRFADRFDPRGYIETIAKSVRAIITDITHMDTNPHRHFRILFVFDLHLYCTLHRIDAAMENT